MANPNILLIKDRLHTGDLKNAGLELSEYGQRISEWGYYEATAINTAVSPFPQRELIRASISPTKLGHGLRVAWRNADWAVSRLLVATGVFDYPPQLIDPNVGLPTTAREISPAPVSLKVPAEEFFLDKFLKFSALSQEPLRQELGSIDWLSMIYAEDQILRTAVYEGVYILPTN